MSLFASHKPPELCSLSPGNCMGALLPVPPGHRGDQEGAQGAAGAPPALEVTRGAQRRMGHPRGCAKGGRRPGPGAEMPGLGEQGQGWVGSKTSGARCCSHAGGIGTGSYPGGLQRSSARTTTHIALRFGPAQPRQRSQLRPGAGGWKERDSHAHIPDGYGLSPSLVAGRWQPSSSNKTQLPRGNGTGRTRSGGDLVMQCPAGRRR